MEFGMCSQLAISSKLKKEQLPNLIAVGFVNWVRRLIAEVQRLELGQGHPKATVCPSPSSAAVWSGHATACIESRSSRFSFSSLTTLI